MNVNTTLWFRRNKLRLGKWLIRYVTFQNITNIMTIALAGIAIYLTVQQMRDRQQIDKLQEVVNGLHKTDTTLTNILDRVQKQNENLENIVNKIQSQNEQTLSLIGLTTDNLIESKNQTQKINKNLSLAINNESLELLNFRKQNMVDVNQFRSAFGSFLTYYWTAENESKNWTTDDKILWVLKIDSICKSQIDNSVLINQKGLIYWLYWENLRLATEGLNTKLFFLERGRSQKLNYTNERDLQVSWIFKGVFDRLKKVVDNGDNAIKYRFSDEYYKRMLDNYNKIIK